MANVFDIAEYILTKQKQVSVMKLQKLVYYSYAWTLVWDGKPLFSESIEAWVNGPVVPELYHAHKGQYEVEEGFFVSKGNPDNLTESEKESIDAVLRFYGDKTAWELSALTHAEEPWLKARKGYSKKQRGSAVISKADIDEYYSSLV